MPRISLQDIFNAAWQAFIVEDKPPAVVLKPNGNVNRVTDWVCRYLTPDGRKCAIGLVIPDGHPLQKSEQIFPCMMEKPCEVANPLFDEQIHNMNHRDLREFQLDLHDNLESGGEWIRDVESREIEYRKVAKRFNLTIPGEEQ